MTGESLTIADLERAAAKCGVPLGGEQIDVTRRLRAILGREPTDAEWELAVECFSEPWPWPRAEHVEDFRIDLARLWDQAVRPRPLIGLAVS